MPCLLPSERFCVRVSQFSFRFSNYNPVNESNLKNLPKVIFAYASANEANTFIFMFKICGSQRTSLSIRHSSCIPRSRIALRRRNIAGDEVGPFANLWSHLTIQVNGNGNQRKRKRNKCQHNEIRVQMEIMKATLSILLPTKLRQH